MNDIKIAFFDAKPYDQDIFEKMNQDYSFKITYFNTHLNSKTASLAKEHDVVCAFVNDDLNKNVVDQLIDLNVSLIALRCAGYNNVDFKTAFNNIHVVRVPEYSPYAVAEHALALMLSLNRKIHKAYSRTRDSNFSITGLMGFDVHGKTIGVIGTGKIGCIFMNLLKGFDATILAYSPRPKMWLAEEHGFSFVELDELYERSDIISLHCPLNKDTHHIINKESISKMKEDVMILNTSRGALINTQDLIEALKERRIGAAALDVYEEESEYFFEDFSNEIIADDTLARLLTLPNVLLTSHQAYFTREALTNIASTTLENIKNYYKEQTLMNEICYKCGRGYCNKDKYGFCFKK